MKKQYWLLLLAIPFLVLLALQWQHLDQQHAAVHTPDGFLPRPGDPIDLRANRVAIVRQVSTPPYEGIELFDDRRAYRFAYPQGPGHPFTERVLSLAAYRDFTDLQSAWCQDVPDVQSPSVTARVYEIGIRCSAFRTIQVALREDELPAFIRQLRDTLPVPYR